MVDKLINSLDQFSTSAKKKLVFMNNLSPLKHAEGGKKQIYNHANLHDNVVFDTQNTYSNKQNLEKVLDYYKNINKHERDYNFSPEMFSFYPRERLAPEMKYGDKIRALHMSPENPNSLSI
jgi:hypothetical protein